MTEVTLFDAGGRGAMLDAEITAPGVLDDLCQRATHVLFSETGPSHYVELNANQMVGEQAPNKRFARRRPRHHTPLLVLL
jgi:hypothetical protein